MLKHQEHDAEGDENIPTIDPTLAVVLEYIEIIYY